MKKKSKQKVFNPPKRDICIIRGKWKGNTPKGKLTPTLTRRIKLIDVKLRRITDTLR